VVTAVAAVPLGGLWRSAAPWPAGQLRWGGGGRGGAEQSLMAAAGAGAGDWGGGRTLHKAGRVERLSTPGNHLEFSQDFLLGLADEYLKAPANSDASKVRPLPPGQVDAEALSICCVCAVLCPPPPAATFCTHKSCRHHPWQSCRGTKFHWRLRRWCCR
jgi:hypothetical protein